MSQQNAHDLAPIIISLTSEKTDDQTRQNAQKLIINSFSDDLMRSFIELIKSNQFDEQTINSSIIVFSNILKNIKMIGKITNISSILIEVYSISIHLILNSNNFMTAHLSATLLIASVNSFLLLNQSKQNQNLLFFQDLFNGILNNQSFFSLHGFCFATCDLLNDYSIFEYCNQNQINDFFNGIINILQQNYNLYENKQKINDFSECDHIFIASNEFLNLSKTIFEQDEIYDFLSKNPQIFETLLKSIFNFLSILDTFENSIECFTAIVDYDQILLFPLLPHIVETISNFISNNNIDYSNKLIYDSIFSICNFFKSLSSKNSFLFLDLNIPSIITNLCKIASIVPINCDLNSNWEPHNISQIALFNIIYEISQIVLYSKHIPEDAQKTKDKLSSILTNLVSLATNLLSSPNYFDRSTSLIIFQSLIEIFEDSIFFPAKPLIFQLVNDDVPRVRQASIQCLIKYVSTFPDHRCSSDSQFRAITEIFQVAKDHLNENSNNSNVCQDDCSSISMSTFRLLFHISLIPGFESLAELMNLIFINLPYLLSINRSSILRKTLQIIRESHLEIMNSYPTIENLFIFCMSKLNGNESNQENSFSLSNSNLYDSLPYIVEIILEYFKRFNHKLVVSPDLIQILINFLLSVKPTQSSFGFPLIGYIFFNILNDLSSFNEIIPALCKTSFSLLQKTNEVYSDQDPVAFSQCSIHSILFFKYMILRNLIPETLAEMIFNIILPYALGYNYNSIDSLNPNLNEEEEVVDEEVEENAISFDLQVYSMNLSLIIAHRAREFLTCNGDAMMKSFTSILNPYNFLNVGKNSKIRLFKIVIESFEIVLSMFPAEFFADDNPAIIKNFINLMITLKEQSSINLKEIMKLFNFVAKNFPIIVRNEISEQFVDFRMFVKYFSSNEVIYNDLKRTTQNLKLKL